MKLVIKAKSREIKEWKRILWNYKIKGIIPCVHMHMHTHTQLTIDKREKCEVILPIPYLDTLEENNDIYINM